MDSIIEQSLPVSRPCEIDISEMNKDMASSDLHHSQIACIPPEVLLRIFREIWTLPDEHTHFEHWDWLAITSTCRQWRSLTLSTASLWVEIKHFKRLNMLQTFLNRSQSASLVFKFTVLTGFFPTKPEVVEVVSHHIWRGEEIYIHDVSEWDKIESLVLSSGCFPRLKKLSLLSRGRRRGFGTSFTAFLQLSSSPRLDELHLHAIYIPFTSDLFKGLRRLTIGDLGHNQPLVPLLNILEQCMDIQYLRLSRVGLVSFSADVRRRRTIKLSRLSEISLDNIDFDSYLELFSCVIPKNPLSFSFYCYNYPSNKPLFPNVIGMAITSCSEMGLSITPGRLTIILGKYELGKGHMNHGHRQSLQIKWQTDDILALEYSISSILESLPTLIKQPFIGHMTVTSIRLYFLQELSRMAWVNVLQHLPSIKILDVSFGIVLDIHSSDELVFAFTEFPSLRIGAPDDGNMTEESQYDLCPNLEELYLRSFKTSSEDVYRRFINHLKEACSKRGQRLRKLSIGVDALKYGNIEEEVRRLNDIADNLEIYPERPELILDPQ